MKKQELSKLNQYLIDQCQRVNFGRIMFFVRNGEPDLGRPWHTRRTVKLAGADNGPRPEANLADFELRQEQAALFDTLNQIKDEERVTVEVRHGLPFVVEIEQDYQAA